MGTRHPRAATAFAALIVLVTLAIAAPAGAGAGGPGAIEGRVVDSHGAPVVAAIAAYGTDDGLGWSSLVGARADGTYTLAVAPGRYRLVVFPITTSGLAQTWYGPSANRAGATDVEVASGATIEGIDVVLPVAATLSGTVTDELGAPVAGATIWAQRPGDTWTGSGWTVTGPNGTYFLRDLTTGDYRVHVVPPAGSGLTDAWFGGATATVVPVAGGTGVSGIDVTLPAAASIEGSVSDLAGDPVAGATVRAFRPAQTWVPAATATTDATGAYRLDRLAAADYQVLVTPPPGSGSAPTWLGPSATRAGSPALRIAVGDHLAGTDISLLLDFPYEGTIDLTVDDPERCDVIAPDCLLPFPSDVYTIADPSTPTGRRVHLDRASMPANASGTHIDPRHWNELDGFSPGAAALLRIPDVDLAASGAASLVDPSVSLGSGSPIVLLDATTGERIAHWAELDSYAEPGSVPTLAIHPAVALPEGHRIVVAVRDLVTTAGAPVAPTDGFRAFRDRLRSGVVEVERRRVAMEQVFSDLVGAGIDRDGLIAAWDFTIASAEALSGRLVHMRDDAFGRLAGGAPSFTVTSDTTSTREGIAREVIGTYEVPLYLTGTGEAGSELVLDADGLPTATGTYTARFRCIIPASASATNPASTGLYGHGLLGSYDQIGAARAVAVGGNRVFCGTDLIGMAEDDIPNAVAILRDVSTFNTLADRLQQGHLNTLFLGRLLVDPGGFAADPAFQDDGAPLIAGDLVYYGISQGGIMGAATTAVAQDWTLAMLDVPGSNYSLLLDRSVDFDPFRSIMAPSYPVAADRALGLQLIQMLWDRGEADGYLQHLTHDPYPNTPAHRVLLHAAFGDHQVSNVSTAIEARSIGAAAVRPALAPGRSAEQDVFWAVPDLDTYPYAGSAVAMWDSGADPPPLSNQPPRTGDDPHDNVRRTPAAIDQIVAFFATGTVIDVCGGAPCLADP